MLSAVRSLSLRRFFSTSPAILSGHNKWSKIKQKKGANDSQKSAVYGKANRDIVHAVRNGGSADPLKNLALAVALKRAKEQDVPKENIEKAIAKATGGKGKAGENFTYEAIACDSVGVVIECMSDNVNRTVRSIRETLTLHSARFAPVKFMFQRKGYVKVSLERGEAKEDRVERLIETALEAGAEDFEESSSENDNLVEVEFTCETTALAKLTAAVTEPDISHELLASELIYSPTEPSESSEEVESQLAELVEALEANEDTLRVWTSLDS